MIKPVLDFLGIVQGAAAAGAIVFWHASLNAMTFGLLGLDVAVTLTVIAIRAANRAPDLNKSGTWIERLSPIRTRDHQLDGTDDRPRGKPRRDIIPAATDSYDPDHNQCLCCDERGTVAALIATFWENYNATQRGEGVVDVQVEEIKALETPHRAIPRKAS